jgi:hypothetical protein
MGKGSGIYELPTGAQQKYTLSAPFLALLAKDNVSVQYISNSRMVSTQVKNFAPRIGFAYMLDAQTAVRGGVGIFYGGLESNGNSNLGANYPFNLTNTTPTPTCAVGNCQPISYTLESGLPALTTTSSPSQPGFHSMDLNVKTPYTNNYSISVQRLLGGSMAASVAYVGNVSRHLSTYWAPNASQALLRNGVNTLPYEAFPDLGGTGQTQFSGISSYNSLQAKVEKRLSHGLYFLSTYTWGHTLDDSSSSGGLNTAVGDRAYYLLGIPSEYTNSPYDIRQRLTLNGNYQLPFGRGRKFLNSSRVVDGILGGWSTSAVFATQTGTPFTVGTSYRRPLAEALVPSRQAIHLPPAGVEPIALRLRATAPTGTIRARLLIRCRAILSARSVAQWAQWSAAWHAGMLLQLQMNLQCSRYWGVGRLWSLDLAIGAPTCRCSRTSQPSGKNPCNFAWMLSICSTIQPGVIPPPLIRVLQAA